MKATLAFHGLNLHIAKLLKALAFSGMDIDFSHQACNCTKLDHSR